MQFNDYNHSAAPRYPLSNKIINGFPLKQSKHTFDRRSSLQCISKGASTNIIKSKENQECTFEPKTNSRGQKRSFDRFLKDQEIFLLVKQEKIQHLREEINKTTDEQSTRKPCIGSYTKHISACSSPHNADNIFQRLSKEKNVKAFTDGECSFNPKILDRSKSLTRKTDISNLLYEDAKRRQEKQQHFKQASMITSPKINSNTNMLVSRKILAQFTQLVTDDEMNPLIAISILEQIFNVDLNPNKNAGNNLTVQKLLAFISEPTHCNSVLVSSQRLSAFITIAIGGISKVKCFNEEEEEKIFEEFHYLYKERVTKQKKNSCPNILPFKPQTLAKSNKLAESFREKTCQQLDNFRGTQKININLKDGNYTIEDLFILDHVKRQAENEKKKMQKQNQELQKCTFKPDISPSNFSLNVAKKKPKVTLRVPIKARQSKMKTQQTDYPQAQTNLSSKQGNTYASEHSNEVSVKVSRCNSNQRIKDMEKAVMRMSVGRQQRQLSSTFFQRGYPEGENWNTLQRQMHRQSVQGNNILKGLVCQ